MKTRVAIPLYKRDQWTRWQDLFKRTTAPMLGSYDEWLNNHGELVIKQKKIPGNTVHVVEVDIDAYLIWANASGLPVNGHTRTDFPLHVLTERLKATGDFRPE